MSFVIFMYINVYILGLLLKTLPYDKVEIKF